MFNSTLLIHPEFLPGWHNKVLTLLVFSDTKFYVQRRREMKRACVDLWLTESSEENIQEKPVGDRPDTVVSLLYGRG